MATRASARIVNSALSQNRRVLPTTSQIAARKNVADTCFAHCRGKSTLARCGQLTKQLVLHTKVVHSLQAVRPYSAVLQAKVKDEAISADDEQEMGDFNRLGISDTVQEKLRARGINYLFPVQYKAFKESLAGNDMIIQARTGTGKTLSFAVPLVEKLLSQNIGQGSGRKPKVIVMTPTRELASQINQDFDDLSDELSVVKLLGGTPYQTQYRALTQGCDIVVGTPGRIKDLCDKQSLDLSEVQHVVLDEVDHMLDIGFKEQVDYIIQNLYRKELKPQTMLYSATISDWVLDSGRKYLKNKYTFLNFVDNQGAKTATTIEQYALQCPEFEQHAKVLHLINHFSGMNGKAIVFTETKREADRLSYRLGRAAESLHGDKRQSDRERILHGFKRNRFRILIATSVAARGLDIPDVPLVIQLGPPSNKDHYIHRVGRTGRAGKSGIAILLYDEMQKQELRQMEKAANLRFKNLTLPSRSGISEVSLSDALKKLDEVPQELIKKYKKAASQYIDQKGAIEGMAAALVALGGISKMASSSLLTGLGGFTTVQYNSSEPESERAVRIELQEAFESGDFNNIQQVKGKNAFVFDVKSDQVKDFIKKMEEVKEEKCVEVLDELPTLVHENTERHGMHSSGGYNEGRYNRNGPSIDRDRSRVGRFGDSRGSFRERGNFTGNRERYTRRNDTFGDMVGRGDFNRSSSFDESKTFSNSRSFRGNDSNQREFTRRPKKYDMDDDEDF